MALSDALAIEAVTRRGPPCTVSLLLADLGKDDHAALVDALAHPTLTTAAISRALLREGHRINAATLQRHRKGECACAR